MRPLHDFVNLLATTLFLFKYIQHYQSKVNLLDVKPFTPYAIRPKLSFAIA